MPDSIYLSIFIFIRHHILYIIYNNISDTYKNGKIYTIRCENDDTLIYVGSTIQPLFTRWFQHRRDSKNKPHVCFYQYDENWDDWYVELFEKFPCSNKEEFNKKEGQVIREIGTINKQIAGRTKKEWYEGWVDGWMCGL